MGRCHLLFQHPKKSAAVGRGKVTAEKEDKETDVTKQNKKKQKKRKDEKKAEGEHGRER